MPRLSISIRCELGADEGEERFALLAGLDSEAFEVVGETDIGVQTGVVLVEVQERLRATVEDPALALHKAGHGTQLREKRLKLIERIRPGVPHTAQATAPPTAG